jgi:hypothetical protein
MCVPRVMINCVILNVLARMMVSRISIEAGEGRLARPAHPKGLI